MDPPTDTPVPPSSSDNPANDTPNIVVHSRSDVVTSDAPPRSSIQGVGEPQSSLGNVGGQEVEAPNPDSSTADSSQVLRMEESSISHNDAVIVTESPNPIPTPPVKANILDEQTNISRSESRHSVSKEDSYVNGRDGIHVNTAGLLSSTPTSQKSSMITSQGANVSIVLISSALDIILASKEAKRSAPFRESAQQALELIRSGHGGEKPREILEPLRLACETRNEKLMIASLDCISKLISYSFFAENTQSTHPILSPLASPGPEAGPPSLVDLVVHTITACHSETTPETVSLQIVKALLSLVLSPTIFVHHSSLLKAVRTVYNVFLLSADPVNQMVAQGGLTQMVHHVFTRCYVNTNTTDSVDASSSGQDSESSRRPSLAISQTSSSPTRLASLPLTRDSSLHSDQLVEELTVPEFSETSMDVESPAVNILGDVAAIPDHTEPHSVPLDELEAHSRNGSLHDAKQLQPRDLFVKDAFLVFRALCKLTMKVLNTPNELDLKSHAMRSKLLSLHLVLTILNSHMALFVDPSAIIYSSSSKEGASFIQVVNQYLCLSLSRNAVSPIPQVFEISVEIFWRVLSGMRTKLKKEIEVLLREIFIPILEMRTSSLKQKAIILGMLSRLCQEPQALVEIYLNYDCDSESADNIYEHLMNIISKIVTTAPLQQRAHDLAIPPPVPFMKPSNPSVLPSLSTSALAVSGSMDTSVIGLSDTHLKRQALECLVTVLRSLVAWGTTAAKSAVDSTGDPARISQADDLRQASMTPDASHDKLLPTPATGDVLRQSSPDIVDDPTKFESAKQKKTTLLEGIKKFNFKPNRGIQFLLETGLIPSSAPVDIAKFLLSTDGLSKTVIGEYLGEGDEENIAIMHAFVDHLDFKNLPFVDALRLLLQSFRLPGEAQKIDRFMLKFAERYIAGNSQTPFANADTAYVLAYSTIMLNTDAHNPQVKHRMTKVEFIRNNRGINDGADLPEELLNAIYDEIVSNEIRMKDEISAFSNVSQGPGLASALANVGRNLQKEAYAMQSNGMANKTEALFRTMMRSQRKGSKASEQFFSASHSIHVRPMFEVAWIPFLAGLSGPLQETDDLEIVELCLDGFKSAIHIVCFFDLELERNAFVTTLAKFTFLNNLGEMKIKNMEAIKTLLDIAVTEGNNLKGSWHEVLMCVSQLEHMQLISSGVEVPEAGKKGRPRKMPTEELANESRSTHITVAADMVFSLSHYLSGTAIVDFVQALSDVSWEEIQSSGLSQHPRVFSLQKLVEISYYNMNRIRLEWSNLWDILGEHFNQVCCHNNYNVSFFALDSLRQLAMRFLEKEELPHFKFQKDFLKPFEYTMIHNNNPDIRDMVLQCLQQMVQARVQNMRSGWRTMFGVFSAASKVSTQKVASSAFELVTRLNEEHFAAIVRHGSFADLTACITEFCKASKYQKISLLAIAMLRGIIPVMLECPECGFKESTSKEPTASNGLIEDNTTKFWFPVLFGFYDIIMNGEDLEVRRLALDSLFSTLKTYGSTFSVEFWDSICQELLFPIFAVLKSSQDVSRFSTQEDMSVWLSTTMIQALRDLINLYTFYFDILERFLDGLLDLLCVCICQENDTLARIGTSCLQQLLENNIEKLSGVRWERVSSTFVRLFRTTTPHQLFDETLRVQIDDGNPDVSETVTESNGEAILPAPLSPPTGEQNKLDATTSLTDRRRIFKQIIVKCVLQLLLIETTNDLLRIDKVYRTIPPEHLLRLMGVLDHSYQFARMFNEDKELRTGLWKVGFMKHLPNLLKQESSSAATLVHILLRMYFDTRSEHQTVRPQIAERLLPLGLGVLHDYNNLRADTQTKNIAAWTPVVAEILEGFCRFNDKDFVRYLPAIYPLAAELLTRDIAPEIRLSLKTYFVRVGYAQGIIEAS